jgi:hypothetical protein
MAARARIHRGDGGYMCRVSKGGSTLLDPARRASSEPVLYLGLWIASLDVRRPSTTCVTVSRGGRGRPDPSGCGGEHGGGKETHEKTRGRKKLLWGRGRCWGGGGGFVGGQRQVRVARARDRDDFKLLCGGCPCKWQVGSAVEVRVAVDGSHRVRRARHVVDNAAARREYRARCVERCLECALDPARRPISNT